MRRTLPRLHLVCDDAVIKRPVFIGLSAALMRAGAGRLAFHLRAPRSSGRLLWELARRLSDEARATGSALLVNDRIDVALAAGAHGAHCGTRSLPVRTARKLLGDGRWLGASVHGVEEAIEAAGAGADFVIAGTVHPSRSHPGRPGAGTEWLESVVACGVPVIGIGGITVARVQAIRATGAAGVAVLGAIWDAADPVAALERFIEALD